MEQSKSTIILVIILAIAVIGAVFYYSNLSDDTIVDNSESSEPSPERLEELKILSENFDNVVKDGIDIHGNCESVVDCFDSNYNLVRIYNTDAWTGADREELANNLGKYIDDNLIEDIGRRFFVFQFYSTDNESNVLAMFIYENGSVNERPIPQATRIENRDGYTIIHYD